MALRIQKLLGISPAPEDEERTLSRRPFGRRPRLPVVGSPVPGDEERNFVDETPRTRYLRLHSLNINRRAHFSSRQPSALIDSNSYVIYLEL